jgi:hypothetical protein
MTDPSASSSPDRLAARAATLALAAVAFALALVTRADADLWGHLRFGLDLIETGRLAPIDPYSFTQDVPWTNHEWLSELQMAWAYRVGGTTGLLVLKAALLWVVFAIVWRALREAALSVRLGAAVVLAMGTIHMTSSVRPQLWTFIFVALLCLALASRRPAARWWLPLLFVIWVNCHGGWIVGLGVLGAWATGQIWQAPGDWRHWTSLTAICLIATLANPYGTGLWAFIATTVRMTRPIDEWQSLWSTPVLNWMPWFFGVAGIGWAWSRRSADRLSMGLTLAMLAYASARVMRIESLFVTAAVIVLAPDLAARWPRRPGILPTPAVRVLAVALLVAALASSTWVARRATSCVPITGTWTPDLAAMAALTHAGPGRIVTPFNWGQYAIWHLSPRLRVSMDGRRETIYSEARLRSHDALMAGTPEGLAELIGWQVEYAWLPRSASVTAGWLVAHGYRTDVETPQSWVLVRGDLATLPPPAVVARPCFPG